MNPFTLFISKLEPKDWITLIASSFALVFSVITYLQKARESKITIRKQLTELLEKLAELNTEISKYRHLQKTNNEYPPNYLGLMADQRRLLVRQAHFLASKVIDLVAPYEFLIIAGAFDGIDQTNLAEKYFNLSMKTDELIDRGVATRGYARYLFNDGKIDDARNYYEEAVECFGGSSSRMIHYRAQTYERWAQQEKEWGNFQHEFDLLSKAGEEYRNIKHENRRNTEITRINQLLVNSMASESKTTIKQ